MKIAHFVTGLSRANGVTVFVENVVSELNLMGHEAKIFTPADAPADMAAFDVVHLHGLWHPWLHRQAVVARKCGTKIVWSTHGMTAPWSMRHKWWKKCIPWYLYQKRDLALADAIHCTVEKEVAWNQAFGFRRTFIVPLGTSLSKSNNQTITQSNNSHVLLFVGRVYPVKAIDRLIVAFQMVQHDGWELRIVGPDQAGHMEELKSIAGQDVEFIGPKYGNELDAEYSNCDALALVSHTENFGATVVDAMAHGKPVITSVQTPWREVVDQKCGWWVDNEPSILSVAIREMISLSDAQRREMGSRGRKLVEEKYTWSAVTHRLIEGYSLLK